MVRLVRFRVENVKSTNYFYTTSYSGKSRDYINRYHHCFYYHVFQMICKIQLTALSIN